MLDAWVIEKIKREEEEKQEQKRPFLELPIVEQEEREEKIEDKLERGVIEIQL